MFIVVGCRAIFALLVLTLSATGSAGESAQRQQGSEDTSATATFLDQAAKCIASIEDPQDQVFRLCDIARIQSRHDLRDAAIQTLRQAREAASRVEDPDYRAHRLADIAAGHVEAGDVKTALELVNDLPEMHRASALRYVSEAQAKKEALESAAETAAMIGEPIYRGEAFQRIATAYADRADFVTAQRIASGISELSAQARAWATIAVAQLRAGERPAAEKTLSRATKTTAEIPYDPAQPTDHKAAMMAELAGVQAEFGIVEGARRTAEGITQAPWQDLAWGNIATAQAKRGDVQAALRTANSIQVSYYRGQAVSAMVAALAQTN